MRFTPFAFAGGQPFLIDVDYLIVGGGGAGGRNGGGGYRGTGGGGAGGYLDGTLAISSSATYPIIVGAGGIGFTSDTGNNGSSSVALGLTALGGGGGAGQASAAANGGSGGGGASEPTGTGVRAPGTGSIPQGTNGGAATSGLLSSPGAGGGGGGALTSGSTPVSGSFMGGGGAGKVWLDGVTYAAGGNAPSIGAFTRLPVDAAPNTGNGGGGVKAAGGIGNVSSGGSGIVIIRYLTGKADAKGGTITTSGGYTYHTFTSNGTLTT